MAAVAREDYFTSLKFSPCGRKRSEYGRLFSTVSLDHFSNRFVCCLSGVSTALATRVED